MNHQHLIRSLSIREASIEMSKYELEELSADYVRLAHGVSTSFSLCQGGGGNVSVKYDNYMAMKCSGQRLRDADMNNGFLILHSTHPWLARSNRTQTSHFRISQSPHLRPSIETGLHLDCLGSYVAHIHSVGAIALGISTSNNPATACPATKVVPFALPGQNLLAELTKHKEWDRAEGQLLLQNHGQISWSTDLKSCIGASLGLELKCLQELDVSLNEFGSFVSRIEVGITNHVIDFSESLRKDWLSFILSNYLVPDQVVYLHDVQLSTRIKNDRYIDVSGLGQSQVETLALLALLGRVLTVDNVVTTLSRETITSIINDESEKVRKLM